MNFQNQFNKIQTDDNLMETARQGNSDFPFYYYYENMLQFDFHCISWHWHAELEFVYIESGTVSVDAGEHHFELSAGSGFLINSKVLHRLSAEGEAIIPNFLFLPTLIAPAESRIYEKYVEPVLSSSMEFAVFHPEISWQNEVLKIMKEIINSQKLEQINEMHLSIMVQECWLLIYENAAHTQPKNKAAIISRARLQLMMQYIHDYYDQAIQLADIANAANISESSALHLFQEQLKITPVNYLIVYRLRQAARQLAHTEKKISVIAQETGFQSVDYFCRSFKKTYGRTPTDYRKHRNYTIID